LAKVGVFGGACVGHRTEGPAQRPFWRDCILFWSTGLDMPFTLTNQLNDAGQYAM
jgi:hypothetical protein